MKKLKLFLVISLCSGIFSSCLDSGKVGQNYPVTINEEMVKDSCGKMNNLTDLLAYDSFKWAMVCWGWHSDYPVFYSAVLNIDSDSWNHLTEPLNQFFFNDRVRRDRYLKSFNRLERDGILDDLETFLAATTEKNINDLLYRLLGEALVQDNGALSITALLEVLEVLNSNQEAIIQFEKIYKATVLALEGGSKEITLALKDLVDKDEFREKRISIIDQFFKSLASPGISSFDRNFINSFLSFKKNGETYWPYQWIQQLAKDPGPLLKLLSYGNTVHPTASQDFRNLLTIIPSTACQANDSGDNYIINTEVVFRVFLEKLSNSNLVDFINFVNQKVIDLHLANTVCDIEGLGVDLASLITGIIEPLRDNHIYLLLQRIHQNIFEVEKKLNEKNPYYFIHFYLGDFYQKVADLNKYIVVDEKSHLPQALVQVFSFYSEKDYEYLSGFVESTIRPENLEVLNGVGEVWLALNPGEKEYLLGLLDIFFKNNLNYVDILKFLGEFVEDLKNFLPLLADHLASNEEAKSKTLWSLYNIAKELRGPTVLVDLKGLLSQQEILRTIRTVSKAVFGEDQTDIDWDEASDDKILTASDLLKIGHANLLAETESQEALKCFEYLSNLDRSFENLIFRPPEECQNMESDYFSIKLFQYLSEVNIENIELGYGPLITDSGLGNEKILNEFVRNFLSLESSESPMRLVESIDFIKEVLFTEDKQVQNGEARTDQLGITALEDGLYLLRFLLKDNESNIKNYLAYLKDELAKKTDIEIAKYIQTFSKILGHYSQSREARVRFEENHSCQDMFTEVYRLGPCLDKESIKSGVKRILSVLKRKYTDEGKKAPFELLIQALAPGHGLRIPILENGEEKYIDYVIGLEQYLLYAYDTFTNSSRVRYYTGPDRTSDFFDSEIRDAEQTEIVIRDVSFFGNYFGLKYLNSTTLGWDYIEEAKKSTGQFKMFVADCMQSVFCDFIRRHQPFLGLPSSALKWLPKKAKFWSSNVVNTSRALIAVGDSYEHLDQNIVRDFSYDTFMKTFLAIFVQSSRDDDQYTKFMHRISNKHSLTHNGEAILRLAEISAFKNMARFVYDRFGPEKEHFDEIVFGDEVQRVNRKVFQGMEVRSTQQVLMNIFNKYLGNNGKLDTVIDSFIDWVARLPYEKQRIVEEVVGDIIIIISSLGEDKEDKDFKYFGSTYAQNSAFNYIGSLENWFLIAHDLIKNAPEDIWLFDAFDAIRDPVRFIRNGLSKNKMNFESNESDISERRKLFYTFINESFKILDTFLVERQGGNVSDLLLTKVQQSPKMAWNFTRNSMSSLRKILRAMHFGPSPLANDSGTDRQLIEDRKKIEQLAKWLAFYSSEGQWKTTNIRNWLASTSYPLIDGQRNTEYEKLINLIDYLLRPSDSNSQYTNLRFALYQLLVVDYESLQSYINEILTLFGIWPKAHHISD